MTSGRASLYRLFFALAAAYNVAFGIAGVLFPHAFFDIFRMTRPQYPALWQVLAMVLGLYGLGYAYAAARPDRAVPWIAIGLAGKVLGPIGWAMTVGSGEFPIRTVPLVVFDDIVWWLPFSLFLLEGTAVGARLRALAPYACAGLNLVAALVLVLVLRPGTEAVADMGSRLAYVVEHPVVWRAGWAVWIAAALSLLAFYCWWGSRLPSRRWALAAVLVAAAGLAFDLTAEALMIGWLPQDFGSIAPIATILTGGLGNGLYTVAGAMLTLRTPALRPPFALLTWAVWGAGFGLSACTFAGFFPGAVACTAVLFVLFSPWVVLMARKLG
jgi:hypothetical protein